MRWRVTGLYLNPSLAEDVTSRLVGRAGVIEVTANPRTGRTLVVFDQSEATAERLEVLILEALAPQGGRDEPRQPASERGTVAQHRRDILLGVGISSAAAVASLARMFILGRTLNRLLNARSSASVLATAGPSAVLTVICTVVYIRLKRETQLAWSRLGRRRQSELRMELARRMTRVDLGALELLSITDLANTVRSGLSDIERGYDGAGELIYIAGNTVVLSTAFLLLAPGLSWIPFLALAAMAIDARRRHIPTQRRYLKAGVRRNMADRHLTELIDGLTTIKGFGLEQRKLTSLLTSARSYESASLDVAELATANPLRLELITLLGVDAVTLGAGIAVGARRMSSGTQVALMLIAGHLFYAFGTLGPSLDNLNRGLTASNSLREISRLPLESVPPRPRQAPKRSRLAITFEDVKFHYRTRRTPTLRGVTLRIPPGSFVGIVGASGSGKSTLVKLLLRFYDPTAGAIRIDGADSRTLDRAQLRALVASVDQQSFVFEDTIAHNISLGREGATEEMIRRAARAASFDDFVESLPDRYSTEAGARGSRLSDGQRQRLLIARALLKSAPILVLDEATSQIDGTTEQLVLANLRALTVGRTLIVIAHRLTAVRDADTIFVLDDGRVAESGTHTGLVRRRGGIYRSLWHSQQLRPERGGSPAP